MEYGPTAHNRTVYASPPVGGSGYEKPQSGLRPLCGFSPPHFCGCWNASRSFIATAKTSYTAGTLCEMPPNFCKKPYLYKKSYALRGVA
jgi:hypothetical protein